MAHSCAVITTIRGEDFFIRKWVQYYGDQFGRNCLYVIVDGFDQKLPDGLDGVNFITVPHIPIKTVAFEKRRARIISNLAAALFELFDCVIATDCDEFIIPDPNLGVNLAQYIAQNRQKSGTLSPLGVDLRHNINVEAAFDYQKPILGQRSYGAIDAHYTKPSLAFEPLRWKSGLHRIDGRNFTISDDLFLFHIGLFDLDFVKDRIKAAQNLPPKWDKHLEGRKKLMDQVSQIPAHAGDDVFDLARSHFRTKRRWLHPNKPKAITKDHILRVPERFFGII